MDVVERVLFRRRLYLDAWRTHGAPLSLTWKRLEPDRLALAAACLRCQASHEAEKRLRPDDLTAIDVFVDELLLDAERAAIAALADRGCAHLTPLHEEHDVLPDPDEAPDEVRDSYVQALVDAIERAVAAHNSAFAAWAEQGVPIALGWQARREEYVYLELACRCARCGEEGREDDCNDSLRISEDEAPWIDVILATEEKSAIEYLVRSGCPHLAPILGLPDLKPPLPT